MVYASTSNASNTLTLMANGRYAVQIPVTAETSGAKSPVEAGAVFGTELADVVSVYAQSDFTAGSDAESNSALTTRLASGMATSCWGNRYQAEALIRRQVPAVCAVSITGFGDAEMTRDQLVCLPISVGGKADIYVKTAMESRIYSCTANFVRMKGVSEEWTVNIPASAFPGCYRATAAKKDGSSYPVASQQVISGAEGTADQVLCITFLKDDLSAARTADTFDIVLEGQSDINTVADIFTSESLKPVTEDVRVISARPAFVNLTVYLSQYADNEDAIRAALSSAIDSSGFCGKLSLSELLTAALPCLVPGQKIWEIRSSVELWGFIRQVRTCFCGFRGFWAE